MQQSKICIWLLTYLFCSLHAAGQVYELNGKLKGEDQSVYRYKLVFALAGTVMSGYSVTDEGSDFEHRSAFKGILDTASRTMSFREEGPVQCPGSCGGHCLISGWGGYYSDSGHIVFKAELLGRPAGFSAMPVTCTRGWLEMKPGKTLKPLLSSGLQPAPAVTDTLLLTSSAALALQWKGKRLELSLADDKEEDGDRLSVWLNGKLLVSDLELTRAPYALQARLRPGKNTLTIRAENNGALPPNTARILLYDGQRTYVLHSVINARREAVIEIVYNLDEG